jgi:putative transposase
MPHTYTNLNYHLVFSTKNREPLITDDVRPRLYDYMGGIIRQRRGMVIEMNGVSDHVHVLARLHPNDAVAVVLRELKSNATGWMHKVFPALKDFSWQNGYGAFTVSYSQVRKVQDYIRRQEEHHQKRTFRDEFILLLKKNGIEFDERYLWI